MLTALAGVILAAAALWDVCARLIPNALPLALAATGLAHLALAGGLLPALAVAGGFFAVGLVTFALGVMGGGDAKLLAAVGLWVPPAALSDFFTVMALTGAVLALAVVTRRRLLAAVSGAALAEPASVPYGAAIAAGAGYVLFAPV
ncbi:MAG: prepilin peptidase [Alphaproteobacteria bacterium]